MQSSFGMLSQNIVFEVMNQNGVEFFFKKHSFIKMYSAVTVLQVLLDPGNASGNNIVTSLFVLELAIQRGRWKLSNSTVI